MARRRISIPRSATLSKSIPIFALLLVSSIFSKGEKEPSKAPLGLWRPDSIGYVVEGDSKSHSGQFLHLVQRLKAGESGFTDISNEGKRKSDEELERRWDFHAKWETKYGNGQSKKWNPVLKYTAAILSAGVGTFLIFNAFSPVLTPSSECDDAKLSEGPCIASPVVGGVLGGLTLFGVAVGFAVHY